MADKARATGPVTLQQATEVKEWIAESDEFVIGALLTLYQWQEPDETYATINQNGVGFNAFDAGFLGDISRWYQKKGYLSPRQIALVRQKLYKYQGQLSGVPIPLLENKSLPKLKAAPEPAQKTVDLMPDMKALAVRFNFPKGDNRFGETLALIKALPGRRFINDGKFWRVEFSLEAASALQKAGFTFSKNAQKWADSFFGKPVKIDPSLLDSRLFPYQREGVEWIEAHKGCALIGDDQGLGKTAQYLSWLSLNPSLRPALVVCGATLKINWQREVAMWVKTANRTHIIQGRKPHKLPPADIYIVNYDILGDAKQDPKTGEWKTKGWCKELPKMGFHSLAVDEVQKIKEQSAARSRAVSYLASFIPSRVGISGTPFKNRAVEIYNPVAMINPQLFPSFWRFTDRYTIKEHNGFGWTYKGVKNAEELHRILTSTIMIRRKKEEVLTQLPPKTRAAVPLEISNRKEYDKVLQEFCTWLQGTWVDAEGRRRSNRDNPAARMVEIEKLKQAVIAGKFEMARQWVEDFLESEKKLIIFATHRKTLDMLQASFPKISVRVDGGGTDKSRQLAVDRFQNDDSVRLFLGNIIAAGEGITLTAASDVAFMEYSFVPADHLQAEDRAHRIGQHDNVTCWYLMAAGTIEEFTVAMLQEKAKVLDQVLDGKTADDSSVFDAILDRIQNPV